MPLNLAIALAGVDNDKWSEEVKSLMENGKFGYNYRKSPGAESIASVSSKSASASSIDSQCYYRDSIVKHVFPIYEMFNNPSTSSSCEVPPIPTETQVETNIGDTQLKKTSEHRGKTSITVMYGGRNILDLGSNLQGASNGGWNMVPSQLKYDADNSLNSASLISRSKDELGPVLMRKCPIEDCCFEEPRHL